MSLLHHTQLHQHDHGLLRICGREQPTAKEEAPAAWWTLRPSTCKAGTGASVAQVPGPCPKTVKQEPEPQCQV